MQADVHVEFDTALSPEGIVAALTDFSATRPETWPTLDAAKYRVIEAGETSATVREGSRSPSIWAREHYDWAEPGTVTWAVQESDAFAPGSKVTVRATPAGDGGSHVRIDARRISASAKGAFVVTALRLAGTRVFLSTYKPVFDGLAAREGPCTATS